jgi:uncharacterized protein
LWALVRREKIDNAAQTDYVTFIVSLECIMAAQVNPDPVKNFAELSDALHFHLEDLRKHYAVRQIGIFGSFVRGEQQEGSDVDVLVDFSRPVGFVTFIKLENRLEEILGRKVDLVTRKALKPHIGRRILDEVRYVH